MQAPQETFKSLDTEVNSNAIELTNLNDNKKIDEKITVKSEKNTSEEMKKAELMKKHFELEF